MAKGTVVCKCTTCGQEFKKTAYFHKRRDANKWEEYAKDNSECLVCYRKRMLKKREDEQLRRIQEQKQIDKENFDSIVQQVVEYFRVSHNKAVKLTTIALNRKLPEIEAVSEKQFSYAKKLRDNYVLDHAEEISQCLLFYEMGRLDEILKDFEKSEQNNLKLCIIETNAFKIIDALKCY